MDASSARERIPPVVRRLPGEAGVSTGAGSHGAAAG